MINPQFSVIIPNYNRSSSVRTAVRSVLNQSFKDFELIVVDDKSTDDSLIELNKIKDEKLNVYQLEKNSGAATARNYGANIARGEFISFLDSDDYYEKDFLEESYQKLSKTASNIGFMWTGVRYFTNEGVHEHSWTPIRKKNAYFSLLHNLQIGSGSGISIKRLAFIECGGFNQNLPAAEDTDFFLRFTQEYDYVNSNYILVNVVKTGEDRMSKSFGNIAKAYNIFLPQHFKNIDSDDFLKLKYYYKMMWLNYHLENKTEARKYYNKIPGKINPGKLKALTTKMLYEFLSLDKASKFHRKISSL
ncbi:glycosyltransferase involved in cell wall biosynthesis [Salegentibacter sp. 24]|uniref:glycosyltransferase family 2 protein n=1 Tax=Salegentibacter sp. 24 TaxID=2183986 RepID=UPI00105EE9AC|nr:glycosyltransferase family 2 protein [Salegentibacter sp. 24]TDN82182.1 glycosyltransferase involved in cell wall biosynthesis [Salegentibacter sp. 24]